MNYKKLLLIPFALMIGQQAAAMQNDTMVDKLKKISALVPWKTVATTTATIGTAYIMNGTPLDTPLALAGIALGSAIGGLYKLKTMSDTITKISGQELDAEVGAKSTAPYSVAQHPGVKKEIDSAKPIFLACGAVAVTALARGAYLFTK